MHISYVVILKMKKIRITAIRKVQHRDLSAMYENPIEHTCDIEEGTTFISVDGQKPEELCESAWGSMSYFVTELANGGGNFYDCLLYTSPSPRDRSLSRMPSSA